LIRNNTYGVYVRANGRPLITDGTEITSNDYGVYVYGNAVAGQNPAPVVTGTNLHGNTQYNYYAANFADPANTVLDATGNWWGSADPNTIKAKIYTGAATSPAVNYSGFLSTPLGQLAVVISNVSLTVSDIQPWEGQSAQGMFTVSGPATVALQIRRESDNAVVYEGSEVYDAAGSYPLMWNGHTQAGVPAAPGLYRVVLIARDSLDDFIYDVPAPTGVGSVSGSVPSRYDPYRNEFYKIQVTMASPGLLSMQATPSGGSMFYVFKDQYYPAGKHWVHWDGRGPDGKLIASQVSIFYPAPKPVRSTAISVRSAGPKVSGVLGTPNIEVKADPYQVSHSYEQVTRMAYRISQDSHVRFALLPPGVADPQDPAAIVLVDNQLLPATDASGTPVDHIVEWRGYEQHAQGKVLVDKEGPYTFTIEARSASSQQTTLYRGVVNLYR
jgi:hypothetical protein